MKKGIITILTVLACLPLFGQKDIHSTLKPLFNKAGILEAEKLVNQYLKEDPNNVDALMYMGNVVYYKNKFAGPTGDSPVVSLNTNNDESIYESSFGFIGDEVETVPEKVANEAVSYWLKAVSIDPKRDDIHLGISHIYSVSLQIQKLIDYLPTVKKHTKLSPYDMANYARNIMERDRWEDGIKVYKAIAKLYPEIGGIYSDIASEYYLKGQIDLAIENINLALQKDDKDEMTYGNAFFLYSIAGSYTKALQALVNQDKILESDEHLLYKGIVELYQGNPNFSKSLNSYLESDKATVKGLSLASMLLDEDFKPNGEWREKLMDAKLNDGYLMPLNEYISQKSNDFAADFAYAEALTYHSIYNKAVNAFASMDLTKATAEELENYYFYYAWAKYKGGDAKGALPLWEQGLKSTDFYIKSAAAYFMGKYHYDAGDKKKAKEYFNLVADKPSESKFANFCSYYIK